LAGGITFARGYGFQLVQSRQRGFAMSKKPLLLALLGLLVPAPALVAGPPEGPSGRQVQDAVPALQDEVKRLEKEVARDKSRTEELDVARARLVAAQGRMGEARAVWRKVIAAREEAVARWEALVRRGEACISINPAILRGPVAEARCGLAEAEGDRATLARELPKVIAYREERLAQLRRFAKDGAYAPEEAEQEEKSLLKEIREARQRLDAVKAR
jgi:hypothetical protein